ncbi:MAG: hypothetical protein LPK85_06780 [Gammaproteobacteria bacterium]|nr:hypothetical protein [Gammaproteobacteria bacterium]
MINLRYIQFTLMAIIASGVGAALMLPSHREVNLWVVALSTLLAIPFMSLVVIRLPVFRRYYRQHPFIIDDGRRRWADQRAAAPMAGIVTSAAIGLMLLPVGVSNAVVPAFCAGIAASVMSFYHEP